MRIILVYDSKGKFSHYLFIKNARGRESYFDTPRGIAVDAEGHIYVCDPPRHMVVMLDKKGHVVARFGKRGGDIQPILSLPETKSWYSIPEIIGFRSWSSGDIFGTRLDLPKPATTPAWQWATINKSMSLIHNSTGSRSLTAMVSRFMSSGK